MEEFKEITGYEGLYWISNLGTVKSKRKSQLKMAINKDGYYVVNLCKENVQHTFNIHRLVAIHFLETLITYPKLIIKMKTN